MVGKILPRPTDAELTILRVLWERGDSTVREVQAALQNLDSGAYFGHSRYALFAGNE